MQLYTACDIGGDGVKRGLFSESETKLVKAVEQEFELFKYKMLSKSREEIFDECNAIRFYSCIYEYFLYKTDIKEEYIKACLKYEDIIATLYHLYMKYEYLRYSRWEDIEELLNVLVREQENDGSTMPQPE